MPFECDAVRAEWELTYAAGTAEGDRYTPPLTVLLLHQNTSNCTFYVRGGTTSMHSSFFKFVLVLKSVLPFWKLLCSVFVLQAKIVLTLASLQLLMLLVWTLAFGTKTFLSIIFHNGIFLRIEILIVFNIHICTHIFCSRRILVCVIALTEFLLLSKWQKLHCCIVYLLFVCLFPSLLVHTS
jgi:hypothetical protein